MSVVASASGMVLGKIFSGKIMFILLVAIIAIVVIFKLVKKAIDPAESEGETADRINNDLDKEIDQKKLSYSPSVYKANALVILSALDGATEDEEVVYSVFEKMNTQADVLQLIKDFGYREATTWGLLTPLNVRGTLPQWINRLFDADEKEKLNNILADKGIDYEF